MPAQNHSTAYAYSTAPQRERRYEETPHIVRPKKRSKAQLRRESRLAARGALKAFTVATVMFVLFGAIIFSRVSLIQERQKTEELQATLQIYESENVRLNVEMNSFASDEAIDDYAVNVLGLQKLERYQIHYFGNESSDEAVVYND